jgi:hypothetical protein
MAVDVRYRNFFIPRVVKNLKISPWEENFLPAGSFLEVFSTLGMKKFLYPTSGSFGNPLFVFKFSCTKALTK